MTLKIGYLLPTRERVMGGVHETAEILSLADKAEELGFDSVWIGDSLLAKPRHEPMALLAAIAGRTSRIEMGTAVLLPMLRNPVLLAHQAATIDQVSEGRLILGFGTARDAPANRNEFSAAGVPFEKRIGRMLEQIRLCRALWRGAETGSPVDWDGLWTMEQADLAPRPYRAGGPPIWTGGSVDGALKRAGRYADGWFPSGAGGPKEWAEGWAAVQGHAEDAGRNPGDIVGAAYMTLSLGDDEKKAEAALHEYLASYYLAPGEKMAAQQYNFAGSHDAATEWLNGFIAAGLQHVSLRFVGDDADQMECLAEMRSDLG